MGKLKTDTVMIMGIGIAPIGKVALIIASIGLRKKSLQQVFR